jgi:hypothetical protein
MRFAFALAAVFAFAVAPSAQSVFDAPALDAPASVFEVEAAPSLSADVNLSEYVTPAVVDVAADDAGFQERSSRAGAGETILYWGSIVGTTAALAVFASLYM